MFGISFTEIAVIATVALIVVGPQKLPGMLRTLGQWVRKLRRLTTEVRQQTGIDDLLRQEGLQGGLTELRSLVRGGGGYTPPPYRPPVNDPYQERVEIDRTREYPPEGPDAYGALPDDLVVDDGEEPAPPAQAAADAHPAPPAEPAADARPAPVPAAPKHPSTSEP